MAGRDILVCLAILLLLSVLIPDRSVAGEDGDAEMSISVGTGFGRMIVRPKVKPVSELKHKNIVRQTVDFSCGAASIATILNFYIGEQVTERTIIEDLFRVGNLDKIAERQGFSLLDIKKLAQSMGYSATGYRTDLEGLVMLEKPSLLPIVVRNYKHFVVFRGVAKGMVFLADPALGNTTLPVGEFNRMWRENVALVIEPRDAATRDELKIQEEETTLISSGAVWKNLFRSTLPLQRNAREF